MPFLLFHLFSSSPPLNPKDSQSHPHHSHTSHTNLIIPHRFIPTQPIHPHEPFIGAFHQIRHIQLRAQRHIKPFTPPALILTLTCRQRQRRHALVDLERTAGESPVTDVGDALVQTESRPGSTRQVEVEIDEQEEEVRDFEGIRETVRRWHEPIPWQDRGHDGVGGCEGAGAGGGRLRGGDCRRRQ